MDYALMNEKSLKSTNIHPPGGTRNLMNSDPVPLPTRLPRLASMEEKFAAKDLR